MATKRRMRRFDEGGTAYNPDQDAADSAADESFGSAFARARKNRMAGGKDTFEWKGKTYKSYRDGEEPKAKSKASAPAESPRQTSIGSAQPTGQAYGADFGGPGRAARAATRVYGADWENAAKAAPTKSKAEPKADTSAHKRDYVGPSRMARELRKSALGDKGEDYKRGGKVKKYARGGGIEQRGKTRGRFV